MDAIVWNNALNTPASYSNSMKEVQSNLVRLVEDSEIKKNVQFDELSLIDQGQTLADGSGSKAEELMGSHYPIIRINDVVLSRQNLRRMTITSSGFVPTIDLTINSTNSLFVSRNMPKDGDIVSIFICTNTNALNYIRDDFIITSCSAISKNATDGAFNINISGRLFIPGLDSLQNTFGVIGTSKEVMKEIARKFNIGFAYNDADDTNDFQNWICCNDSIESFVNTVTSHSWKDGTSFYNTWIDFYYNLCYVNVNKFLLSGENTEDELDYTFNSNTTIMNEVIGTNHTTDYAKMMIKMFTNSPTFVKTPFHIIKWRPVNNSSSISLQTGYQIDAYTFVNNEHVYTESSDNCFDTTVNLPAYDENKLKSHIIFRGRSRWEEGQNPDTDKRRVNYDFVNTYIKPKWTGVEYRMDDEDSGNTNNNEWAGNVHKNYNHAPYHNQINNEELNKMYIEIECEGLCLQVLRGERVPVYLLHGNKIDNMIETADKINDEKSAVNRFYSGFYVVDSISYEYKLGTGGAYVDYKTRMILKRREWPTPEVITEDNKHAQIQEDEYAGEDA